MWLYEEREFRSDDISDNLGFVYIIENLTTGRKYIGQKKFVASTTRRRSSKPSRTLALRP